ncbi:MAG: CAP domain-containing protein [Planctomycetota bacterium]
MTRRVLAPFRTSLVLAIIVSTLSSPSLLAQEESPPNPVEAAPQPKVSTLARQFRRADTDAERRELGDVLMERGVEGREALAEAVERLLGSGLRDLEKELRSYQKAFESTATRLVRSRLNRRAQARIDELRDEIRGLRSGDLTKTVVQSEIDPRLDELRSILWLDLQAIVEGEEKLVEQSAEIEAALGSLELLEDFRRRSREAQDDATVLDLEPIDPERDALLRAGGVRGLRDRVLQLRADARLRAVPMSGSDRSALDGNDELRGELDDEELDGMLALNELRLVLGLPAIRIDTKLCDACRDHSKDMAEIGFFAHESPVEGKRRFSDRAANFGTSASAENIARGQRTGRGAIRGWWYSPGHHKNMMRSAGRTGLGHHQAHWTQLFGS